MLLATITSGTILTIIIIILVVLIVLGIFIMLDDWDWFD